VLDGRKAGRRVGVAASTSNVLARSGSKAALAARRIGLPTMQPFMSGRAYVNYLGATAGAVSNPWR
jgi:hypothetical protein